MPAALNAPGADARTRGKGVADRMLGWGLAAGFGLAALQLAALPLLNVFSPVRVSAPGKDREIRQNVDRTF